MTSKGLAFLPTKDTATGISGDYIAEELDNPDPDAPETYRTQRPKERVRFRLLVPGGTRVVIPALVLLPCLAALLSPALLSCLVKS
jgi:hypothetical protein